MKLTKYLLASHGEFSKGCESFLKIMADAKGENLYTLTAFLDDESVVELVTNKLIEIGEFDQLLVFCDIYGGSVQQEIFRQVALDPRNIQIIAGFNLGLLLDLYLKNQVCTCEEIRQAIQLSKSTIVYVNDQCILYSDELF